MDDPRGSWVVNLGGTLNLLEAVRESSVNPRVLVVSSGVVYGNPAPENIPVREDCPPRPINPYSASKVGADMLAIQYHLGYGLNTMQTGNLEIVRDFTDVRDIVRGYRILMEKGHLGEIYHLGRGQGTKLADALQALREISGHALPQMVDPSRLRGVDLPLLVANVDKIQRDTGWSAQIPIETTMRDLFEGFSSNIIRA